MNQLTLTCFNTFQAALDGQAITNFYSVKAQALLIYLAVEQEQPHTRSALAGLLWPDYSEKRARRNLSQTLTTLRKLLDAPSTTDGSTPPAFQTSTHLVAFNPDRTVQLDVGEFHARLDAVQGHAHDDLRACALCTEHLQQAVDLYTGPFLAGLTVAESDLFEHWVYTTREHLHQAALDAFLQLSHSYAAQSALSQALAVIRRLLALAPWQEEAHRQAMWLLARSGQRTQALAQYDLCIQLLMDELGVPPSAETMELDAAIRAGHVEPQETVYALPGSATPLSPPPASVSPPDVTHFVGRTIELAYFRQKLTELNYAVITGFPGVGKTDLAAKLAREMTDPDQIFWYKCHAGDGVDSLIWALAAFGANHGHDELWHVLYNATQNEKVTMPLSMRIAYVQRLLAGQGYLVCLDDFQHMDEEAEVLQLAQQLLALTQNGSLQLLITSQRMPPFVRYSFDPLVGLNRADTAHLVAASGLRLTPSQLDALYTHTEGHSLFLTLALDVLQSAPNPDRLLADLPTDHNIERYLLQAVEQTLTAAERAVMGGIAILGDDGGGRTAIETILDGESIRQPLRELAGRHLLSIHSGENERAYSQHAMMRAFYYDNLGLRERKIMHRRAATYYAEEGERLRAAKHYVDAEEHKRAVEMATQDVRPLLHQGQATPLRQLLETFRVNQLEPLQWAAVQVALGQVYTFLGESEAAQTSYETAHAHLATVAETEVRRELMYETYRGMGYLLRSRKPAAALRWLALGLNEFAGKEPFYEADLLLQKSVALRKMKNDDAALDALERGLALVPATSNPTNAPLANRLRLLALINLGNFYLYRNEIAQSGQYMAQALALATQLNDPINQLNVRTNLAAYQLVSGDWTMAIHNFQEASRLAQRLDNQLVEIQLGLNGGLLYLHMGDETQAATVLTQALDLARQCQQNELIIAGLAYLADLYLTQERLDAAHSALAEAEALSLTTQIEYQLPLIYRLQAQHALATDDAATAVDHIQCSLDTAQHLGISQEIGPSLRVLGELQVASGQITEAVMNFAQSLARLTDNPYETALTQLTWGRTLLQNGCEAEAHSRLQKAQTILQQLGAIRELAVANALLA
ncbi:hypothetical protein KFU94_49940 [Chloroflexi bacterium TSY]|nr:hypothetical protein [Chloroflexi bacterium TSY]